jgi:hypothetical protein
LGPGGLYNVALNYGQLSASAGAASLIIASIPLFTAYAVWAGAVLLTPFFPALPDEVRSAPVGQGTPVLWCYRAAFHVGNVVPCRATRVVALDAGELVAHGEERGVSGIRLLVFPVDIFLK